MSTTINDTRVLYRDHRLRVVLHITRDEPVSYGDKREPWRMTTEGVSIEGRHVDATGCHSWLKIQHMPIESLQTLLVHLVHERILGWSGGCPWVDLGCAGEQR